MSLASVRAFLQAEAPDIEIIELDESSSTMTLSAAWGIRPAQIAKSLLLRSGEQYLIAVVCGDARLDNQKSKAVFGGKVRMVPPEEAEAVTGHPVGGVCPFGLATPLPVYCDVALKAFDEVVPGAGSTHAALRIDPLRMADLAKGQWVEIC
jgi:prolyl-tRNA editing enzyme YbaK/EbsC (Cys-tRNA(Pro) deacylase)